MKDKEIPRPIGDFIIDNARGIQLEDGMYYHYTEVIKLLRKYGEIKQIEKEKLEDFREFLTWVELDKMKAREVEDLIKKGLI